jgi:hypothetical protein
MVTGSSGGSGGVGERGALDINFGDDFLLGRFFFRTLGADTGLTTSFWSNEPSRLHSTAGMPDEFFL